MKIIPVIDLLDSTVVHAKKGERQNYKAIQSQLTHSSKPLEIVAALLEYFPFQHLYIADLNAIQKLEHTQDNYTTIESITIRYPQLEIWVDAGINTIAALDKWQKLNVRLILGSENFTNLAEYQTVKAQSNQPVLLSLDYLPNGYKGPEELIQSTADWPDDVILMSLSHVGSNQGNDTTLLESFGAASTTHRLYAAGGIRNIDDLAQLEKHNIHGALIATALHNKKITPDQLQILTSKQSRLHI